MLDSHCEVPPGAKRAAFRHTGTDGRARFVDMSDTPTGLAMSSDGHVQGGYEWGPLLRTALAFEVLVHGSHTSMPTSPAIASCAPFSLVLAAACARLCVVQVLVHGHTCVQSLHEGLVLGAAACTHALTVLDTPCKERLGTIGEDLYATEAAVEEFALQSIANSAGLRFAQLSDMGAREVAK